MGPPTNPDKIETTPSKKWVKFEEDESGKSGETEKEENAAKKNGTSKDEQYSGAVIPAESVQINLDRSLNHRSLSSPEPHAVIDVDLHETVNTSSSNGQIRQGFANGDIIVTLLPVNTNCPWVTPAQFRPELVPEELMAQGLTLTVEDYVHIMELLTNDVRFNIYNVCYKRVLVLWIFTAFSVLLGLLFSGLTGLILFGLGVFWLVFNAAAIFLCMWIKIKLNHNLERCMANVNKHLIRHKIILGLDDRGKMSCHKVNLCFIYFDTTECVKKLQDVIEREEAAGRILNRTEETREERRKREQFAARMDIEDSDIIIQGANTTKVSRKQVKGERLLLRYLQRWCKDYLRRRLDWTIDEDGGGNSSCPRHLSSALCPCQHIEAHLAAKPTKDPRNFCPCWSDFLRERGID